MTDPYSTDFTHALRFGSAGQAGTGLAALEARVKANPLDRHALEALAEAQRAAGRTLQAFETYNRRIALGDVPARVWLQIGDALHRSEEYAQAVRALREGLSAARPEETAELHHALGRSLFKLGEIDAAVAEHLAAAEDSGQLTAWLAVATLCPGAPSVAPERILDLRRRFAHALAASPLSAGARPRPAHRPRPGAPLRVGYVSSWFTRANYMKPVWALVNAHDRRRVEVHLFSDAAEGAPMEGYRPHKDDRLHATGALDNAALAALIARQEIDLLVDLNSYSTPERLGLFTSPPAPVCLAWFNMYATSGLPGIDGLVGDDMVVKPGEETVFGETVHRLPLSYLTFSQVHRAPPVVDPPCLQNGHVTFGSLVAQYKITAEVIAAWAEILNAVPDSRLVLANRALDSGENRAWLRARFADHGIDAARLALSGGAPHYDYLQNYDRMDIALDAFPYNGGTTTMEALWQGVPVLTFDGDRWAARTSTTLLRRTHLGDFVSADRAELVAQAIELARDPETPGRLMALRRDMRDRLSTAPVCDAPALARAMEDLYARLTA